MAIVTVKELIEAGVHYGTKTSLWHPRMEPFIFGKRNQIHIIDLKETAKALIEAYYYAQKMGRQGKTILFVGTKRQAKDVVRDAARSIGMPYIAERWLGGTLTNLETIRSSIRRLEGIEEEMAKPDYFRKGKKEQSRHLREKRRILRNLEGVRNMTKLPDAVFMVDPEKEATAVREARKLDIPIIALLDTDCNPDTVNLPIPGNDDGIRSVQVVVRTMVNGYLSGRSEQVQARTDAAEAKKAEAEKAQARAEAARAEADKAAASANGDQPAAADKAADKAE